MVFESNTELQLESG